MPHQVRISIVVIGYALIASSWIVFSDRLVQGVLAGGAYSALWWQTAKGLGFVAVTSGGLYLLMRWLFGAISEVELARLDSDRRMALLFEAVHDQVIAFLDSGGTIVKSNRATGNVLGWTPEEMIGRHVGDIVTDDGLAGHTVDQVLEVVARTGRMEQECWLRRKDGSRFWADVAIVSLDMGGGGSGGFAVIARDRTAWRRAEEVLHAGEERLRESEERARLMMDSSVDGLITIDTRGIIESFSGAAARIFGYEPDDVIGRNVHVLMPEPDRSRHDGYLERYLSTGERRMIGSGREVQGMRADGSLFPMDLEISEVVFGGGQRRFVGTVRDLSERKKIEDQLRHAQKMEAVGQLTGGIAHDFNNLLSVTLGCAELLQEMFPDDPRASKLSATIVEAGRRGADMTRRLLAFSRRQALEPMEIDLGELLAELHDLLARSLGEDIEISMIVPAGLPRAIVDRAQLENAVINLAINARDAMPGSGLLTIAVDRARLDDDYVRANPDAVAGDYLVVAVSDTGAGMPKEVVERAFDPFFTTKPVGKGTGLGLSMVYGFAKQSGGHVKIYSEIGVGSTIRLYLPQSPGTGVAAPAKVREQEAPPGGSERILVVEDDRLVREYVTDRLIDLGYVVTAVGDGPAALAEIDSGRPIDVLFTDVVMPGGMNGRELAEEALRRRPGLKLLFTTGYTEDVMVLQGKLAPGAQLLDKPYGRATLARKLRAVIESRME